MHLLEYPNRKGTQTIDSWSDSEPVHPGYGSVRWNGAARNLGVGTGFLSSGR